LYVTQGYPPERVGGVEVYVKGLAREMSSSHEVFVFSRGLAKGKANGEFYEEQDGGVKVTRVFVDLHNIKEFKDIYLRPWLEDLFSDYLELVNPDVVHIQHLGGLSLGMVKAARKFGVPVVMTFSDHQPYCPLGQRITKDKRVCKTFNLDDCLECIKPQTVGLTGRAAKLASYLLGKEKGKNLLRQMHEDIAQNFSQVSDFIMPSETHRELMVEAGVDLEKTHVLPYGLDLSLLDKVKQRPQGEPVKRFGYLGTLIPSKGVEDVIMAYKRMKTSGCSLHIYGEAVPYHGIMDYDQRLAEMARSADISFYGPYQPHEIARVLENIDALVMPSKWYESYGITIREAFRAKRPVIVSDIGGFTEAVDHMKNGLKYPAGDVYALAEMMDTLASDISLSDKLAKTGGPITNIPDHCDQLLELYKKS
jgi:glycosyltransferase involved in cell wall biosynthesis